LLFTGMVICYAHRGALSVAAPRLIQEMGLSPAVMGVLLSAFFWTYAFMQVPAGWLVDRLGVRRAYALGFALWSLASAITGFAANQLGLIAVRLGVGVGQAVAFPASSRVVADSFLEKERGTITATYLTGVRIGQALVGAAGTLLLAAYGMKTFFLLAGLAPMIWLWPWLRVAGDGAAGPAKSTARLSFLESLALLRHPTALGIFLGFFAYDYVWYVFVSWLPGYLVLERKFSSQEMALYSSVPYLAMSVVILLAGVASDWFIRRGYAEVPVRKAFNCAGLFVACLIVPAGLVDDKMTAVWLLTVSLCGLGLASANTWSLTQAVCSKDLVGTAAGIQNFGGNVGGIIAPALTGYIAHATGSFALALGVAGLILIGGILAYWLMISRRLEQPG
jgi:MFS family permease